MEQLLQALNHLTRELREDRLQRFAEHEWLKAHLGLTTKNDLHEMELRIMSKISDYAAAQAAFNTRQGAAIDSLVTSQAGLVDDVKTLNDKITELQNSAGQITPEDQALLDDLQTKAADLTTRQEGVAAALKALDDQTPPATPPPGP